MYEINRMHGYEFHGYELHSYEFHGYELHGYELHSYEHTILKFYFVSTQQAFIPQTHPLHPTAN